MRAIKNLIGAILISIAVFLFWVMILPNYEKRSGLILATESRSVDFKTKNNLLEKITGLNDEYQSKYAEIKRLSLVIPSKKSIEELITILDGIALQSGVQLRKISLGVQDQSDQSLAYNKIFIDLNLAGTYDSIFNFVETIEKSIRLIDGSELSLSNDNEEEVAGTRLTASFKGTAYFLNPKQIKSSSTRAVTQGVE